MATWPEYAQQTGGAIRQWLLDHPWTPPADPAGPDPGEPAGTPTAVVRINCGGPAVTDAAGLAWEADRGFNGGQTSAQGAGHYGADPVSETERWGDFSYAEPGLPVGPATVRLRFAESYALDIGPGMRKFDVAVQGQVALSAMDPFALGGGQYKPVVREVSATIGADGQLAVAVKSVVNAGCLQGLEVLCYGTGIPTVPPPVDPPPVDPGQPVPTSRIWLSGGNPNINAQSGSAKFGAWRGRPCTAQLCYPTRDNWAGLTSATSGQPGIWTDKTIRLIVQLPPFPQGAYTYAEAAAGKYIPQWQQLARNWKARTDLGFLPPIFSLAWEANHPGPGMHYWGGLKGTGDGAAQHYQSYGEYIAVYRLWRKTVIAIEPRATMGWAPNGHASPGFVAGQYPAGDPWNIYPGDDAVDWIGVDYYDHFPPSPGGTLGKNKVDFAVEAARPNGIRRYLAEAKARGKGLLIAEWACDSNNPAGGNGGGDNPTFVTSMVGVIREAIAAGVPVVECYYDDDAQRMSIMGMTSTPANPKAAIEYQRLYRLPV